jgi:hypothetical protein
VPTLLVAVWGALFFNVLAFAADATTLLPVPHAVGQLLTQGSLGVALVLALAANPRAVVRPNLVLSLLTALSVVALVVSMHGEFVFGSVYRASRLLGFLTVLWLLTPWWGRHDMLLLRCHRRVLGFVIGTVVLGALVAPGLAFEFEGRLRGVLWPIPPTQVSHYAAILFGTSAVLWMCRMTPGRRAAPQLLLTAAILVSTHTRTALGAVLVALAVALGSMFLGHVRARRVSALAMAGGVGAATIFASQLTAWLLRGQSMEEASQLTGRTKVWSAVFELPRPRLEQLFGYGLSDQSFDGLPVDNNWVATYLDQGWLGVVVQACVLLVLLLRAAAHERGPHRALALFLIVYCMVASVTETGFATASPYLLNLTVAAALLAPKPSRAPG